MAETLAGRIPLSKMPDIGDNKIIVGQGEGNQPVARDMAQQALVSFQIAGGESAAHIHAIAAGIMPNDLHIDKVGVTLENAPGGGKVVSVRVTDGVTTMEVLIGSAATSGSTTTNNYDWDVSAKPMTIAVSSTAGTAAGCCSVVVIYHRTTI